MDLIYTAAMRFYHSII